MTTAEAAQEEPDPPTFDKNHYPDGVNGNFLTLDSSALKAKYGGEKGIFEDPEQRDIARNLDAILEALSPLDGLVVADVGAGTGLFSVALDNGVGPEGKVYAIDISEGFLTLLRTIVEERGLRRTEVIKGGDRSPNLPPCATVDLALICDVYHHFEHPIPYLKALRDCMKPGARLVVIDFHRIPEKIWSKEDKNWVLEHVRAGQDVFTEEIISAGFVLEREVETPLTENYFLVFRNPI